MSEEDKCLKFILQNAYSLGLDVEFSLSTSDNGFDTLGDLDIYIEDPKCGVVLVILNKTEMYNLDVNIRVECGFSNLIRQSNECKDFIR